MLNPKLLTISTLLGLFVVVSIPRLLGAQQIMSTEQLQRIESHLPKVEPGIVRDVLNDPTGVWYDRTSMGVAYQLGTGTLFDREFASTGRLGIANAMLNMSPDFPERTKRDGFGGNISALDFSSFPWNPVPGGTHRSPNVDSVKKFWLPKRPNGQPWPVIVYEAELEGFLSPTPTVTGYDWTFPIGTVFLEPITTNDAATKQHYVCSIRARVRAKDYWTVEIMAPFRTPEELRAAIERLRPKWREDIKLVTFVKHLEDGKTTPASLRDRTAGNPRFRTKRGDAFSVSAQVDVLPALDRTLVAELLDTTVFQASAGYEWKPGCAAPTTISDFHIVPQNYDGTFVGLDSASCAKCHDGAQISARRHEAGNQKYGWGRGNKEGILSWHPFEPSGLTRLANPNVKLRQAWVDAGLVEFYDPQKHPSHIYTRITHPISQGELE